MVVLAIAAGCMESPTTAPVKTEPAAVPAETKAEVAEATPAEPKTPALSEEDQRLIAADPNNLTEDERRKRAYALRRKVMQNPDSPAARTLRDLEEAVRNGEIEPPVGKKKDYPTLHLPGAKPESGPPPAGHRPEDGKAPE
jgi:hypothetical protein